MISKAIERDWAQQAYFDKMFPLLAGENWIYFAKDRRCAQSSDSPWGTILKKAFTVPKIDGNRENPLYIICELRQLCPNVHTGVSGTTINGTKRVRFHSKSAGANAFSQSSNSSAIR